MKAPISAVRSLPILCFSFPLLPVCVFTARVSFCLSFGAYRRLSTGHTEHTQVFIGRACCRRRTQCHNFCEQTCARDSSIVKLTKSMSLQIYEPPSLRATKSTQRFKLRPVSMEVFHSLGFRCASDGQLSMLFNRFYSTDSVRPALFVRLSFRQILFNRLVTRLTVQQFLVAEARRMQIRAPYCR